MADLTATQGADTVEVVDKATGNRVIPNADGSVSNSPIDGSKASYSAAIVGLVTAAAATDILTITGSGTKTIRVTAVRFGVSTTSGSGFLLNVSLIKRSTANSAGTSTTPANVPYDSTDAAGTATVKAYTANPTLGTAVGAVRAFRYPCITAAVPSADLLVEFGVRPTRAVVLRGTGESLCLNLNGTTITGPVAGITVEWTEE